MKVQFVVALATGLTTVYSTVQKNEAKFIYKYSIRANSYSPLDEGTLYSYKEKLIDTYEELCLDVDECYHENLIKSNIKIFEFASNVSAYYSSGMINLVIGKGKGSRIQGNLRKNSCDTEVIREKIYIFDILNGL